VTEFHRIIDSSIFLDAYLEQDVPARGGRRGGRSRSLLSSREFLDRYCVRDVLLCDLILGEVFGNLVQRVVEPTAFRTSADAFILDISRCSSERLTETDFDLAQGDLSDLAIGSKDKLIVAFAINHSLTRLTTNDGGILSSRSEIRRISRERTGVTLSAEGAYAEP
jgi:predicted nucleic acid-binding protein